MTQMPDNFDRRLANEMKGLYAGPSAEREDAQILAAARLAGEGAVASQRRWMRGAGFGMAAAVAIAAGVMWAEFRTRSETPSAPAAYARTGDIRDAYFVARGLKEKRALEAGWDVDRDGVVDERDVRMLALAAVKVPGGVR